MTALMTTVTTATTVNDIDDIDDSYNIHDIDIVNDIHLYYVDNVKGLNFINDMSEKALPVRAFFEIAC